MSNGPVSYPSVRRMRSSCSRSTTARTIRVNAGKVSTTVGPFVETKEQLSGFFVIEAKDMVCLRARFCGTWCPPSESLIGLKSHRDA